MTTHIEKDANIVSTVPGETEQNTLPALPFTEGGSCWFCGANPCDPSKVDKVSMYGDAKSTRKEVAVNVIRVETRWKYIQVDVPRCPRCYAAHKSQEKACITGLVAGIILPSIVLIAGYLYLGLHSYKFDAIHFIGGILCVLIIAVLGLVMGMMFGNIPEGIKPLGLAWQYSLVQELKKEGWELGIGPNAREKERVPKRISLPGWLIRTGPGKSMVRYPRAATFCSVLLLTAVCAGLCWLFI